MVQNAAKRGRPRRGPDAERVREVLDAAADAFLENGYDATSMQGIADAVGLMKGSLYYYVASKEDFLFQIIEPAYVTALDAVASLSEDPRAPLDRLTDFVHSHVLFVAANLRTFRIRLREFSQLSPQRQKQLSRSEDDYYAVLMGILRDGVDSGDIDPAIDLRLSSVAILGMLNSMTEWYSVGGRYAPRELAYQLAGMVLTSLGSDAATLATGGPEALRRSPRNRLPSQTETEADN
ncbi:TetR/AcrR family transcriptional regulator [Nocardia australiensis]|uniref:TetR/AcrR family transcriptional regulator n=1 Tax=Nocardia australiensis TaxID=2887191 RepID=UPI001D13B255|nr:TetR/AcrR family transcriptional regulator [Nocardia australiensis]